MDRQYLSSDDDNDNELDQVSLPGVGDNEQPTILEVLNRSIVSAEDSNGNGSVKPNVIETEVKERITGDTVNTTTVTSTLEADELKQEQQQEPLTNDKESDNLVSSSSRSRRQAEWQKPQRSLAEDEENVYDIESHLIETLNDYSVSENSESWGVDIKELPPAEEETLDSTSKIKEDPLTGSVFEVEPATPRILKPIETSVLAHNAQIEQIFPKKEIEAVSDTVSEPELEVEIPLVSTKPIWTIVKEVQEQLEEKKTSDKETASRQQTEEAYIGVGGLSSEQEKDPPSDNTSDQAKVIKTDSDLPETDSKSYQEKFIALPEAQQSPVLQDQDSCNAESVNPLESQENPILPQLQTTLPTNDLEVDTSQLVEKRSTDEEKVKSGRKHNSGEIACSEEVKQSKETESTIADVKLPEVQNSNTDETSSFVAAESTQAEVKQDHTDILRANKNETANSVDQVDNSTSIANQLYTENQVSVSPKDKAESSLVETASKSDHAKVEDKSDATKFEQIEASDQTSNTSAKESSVQSKEDKRPDNENLAFNPFQSVEVVTEEPEPQDSGGSPGNNTQSLDAEKTNIKPTVPDAATRTEDEDKTDTNNDATKTDLQSKKLESRTPSTEESTALSKEIDQKLSELTSHLTKGSKVDLNGNIPKDGVHTETKVDVNGLPLPQTATEKEQRQQFLDSLPQISPETDTNKVVALAKREYYQSLRQYLISHSDKPPIPPETYRWEDLRRAKQRGGYPWTHLYKRPLGPDEEPEIVLLLRKSQELRFSESPKSFKKVRIDDQVSIKETERYIQELSDTEDNPPTEDEKEDQEDAQSECVSCVSDSVLTCEKRTSKLGKIRGILKKRNPRKESDARSLPDTSSAPRPSLSTSHKSEEDIRERANRRPIKEGPSKAKCFPIMKKLRSMADRQKKNFQNIKKISLKKDEKISLEEEQKIIKLKNSPKAERSEIPHFIEKQDSDDVLEIVELDESPSRKRKDQLELQEQAAGAISAGSVVVPDEIIEIPTRAGQDAADRQQTPEPTVSEILEEELKSEVAAAPPKKTARLRREHVYEDIEAQNGEAFTEEIENILEMASVEALKHSLAKQDSSILKDVEATKTALPLERMGSSEEEVERSHLAPISSIDSASSEDERKPHLSTVAEESDDGAPNDKEAPAKLTTVLETTQEPTDHIPWNDIELKPALKKEPSPSPSDKKVTFSHVEDEAEPHREDIELPEGLSGIGSKRWSNLSDHEYEPIGEPPKDRQQAAPEIQTVSAVKKEPSPAPASTPAPTPAAETVPLQELPKLEIQQPSPDATSDEASPLPQPDQMQQAEELQREIEDRYFSSANTTPRTESQADYDVHTSQVDSSALEELPLKPESRKKGFMASAQDRTRKMQAGLRSQAGKIKTKFRSPKKAPSGSPKAKERKRFKAPEFSKIRMPEMKRPDLSGFKRPEFTKFSKPDMSKFKLPDKFSSLKLTRSKSFKEPTEMDDTTVSGTTPDESAAPTAAAPPKKPKFDFSFGTYPRAFRKKKKPVEVESTVETTSVIPSTETQPSAESSSTPQGDRGPGPVRSRWADKFSDVSYNDSEGSRYRRYGSEQESSFDRESSMERRMKEVLEENAKEEAELAMLSVVEQKEFAEYDEENRVIHEISKTREGEFKRRPIVHQDSDLISEEGRDIGWTQREAEKNRLLRKSELETEEHMRYLSERMSNQDTHSTASSKKFVFEEINDDEFLLRKKGISQEFNITPHTKYIDPRLQEPYSNDMEIRNVHGSSVDRMDFGYDVPPPKPRRLSHQQRRRYYDSENVSQAEEYPDDVSYSQAGSDYMKDGPPSRPLRKSRFKNSQEISIGGTPSQFEDEEKENITDRSSAAPPQAPRRRRKQQRESLEKDSYMNGFGGRSVSNSYLKEDNKPDEVIVYRTEHKYKIPLATPEKSVTEPSVPPRKSRSLSRLGADDDDRTSRGVDSINLEMGGRGDTYNANIRDAEDEKYIIEMMENDGYAVVRKENLPKPTPPARRKKFSRSPGERFATMPHMRKGSPAVGLDQKPYSTIGRPTPPRRKSAQSLGVGPKKEFGSADFDDYEVPEFADRTESPRNLQSGDIINRMKYRPLPPPPRPPREKRQTTRDRNGDDDDELDSRDDRDDRDGGGERTTVFQDFHDISSDDYNQDDHMDRSIEVEVSTQTDPLPDDFVCEEFEITDDMKIIEPRRTKTLDEILKEEEEAELERARRIDEEILQRGIQRFREANQRSVSEKSRASSQAKSLSRPQTPSAILIEKRIPTPVPNANGQTVLEASLTVQPIDDLDVEEELLRREGLYDGSHSRSDADSRYQDEGGHASEEENAMVGEIEHSRSYITDAEVHRSDEDDFEQHRLLLEELRLEEAKLEEVRQEQAKLEEALLEEERLEEERLEKERLEEEKLERILEEQRLEEERLMEQRLEELRLEELRLEEQKMLEQQLQEEEEEERKLLEELEKEQKLLEQEQMMKLALEAKQRADEEDKKRKLIEERNIQERLLQTPRSEMVDESVDQLERHKLADATEADKETVASSARISTSQSQPPEKPAAETEDQTATSPPPLAPPRKRSYAAPAVDDPTEALSVAEEKPSTEPVPFTAVTPSHLAIADLEVERLRVHALQAGQIMVSHLHGGQVQAEELECRSGNLVVRNIELPPGFIEDIVERVRSTEREHIQAATQTNNDTLAQTEDDSIPPPPIPMRQSDIPPVRPPPPQREAVFPTEFMASASSAFSQLRDMDEPPLMPRNIHPAEYLHTGTPIGFYRPPDDAAEPPPPVYRRRRHHRRRDSSSDEEQQPRRSRSARPETQTVAQAGRQFISACSLPLINAINQLTNTIRPNNDNKQDQVQPRNISAVIVLFVVMTLSFLIYLLTGRNIHHHHWDYFNPPGNDGRLS